MLAELSCMKVCDLLLFPYHRAVYILALLVEETQQYFQKVPSTNLSVSLENQMEAEVEVAASRKRKKRNKEQKEEVLITYYTTTYSMPANCSASYSSFFTPCIAHNQPANIFSLQSMRRG